jgi:hypothetical protein
MATVYKVEVVKVITKPTLSDKKYWIKVAYLCYGLTSTTYLAFDTLQEAKSIKEGYKFPLIFC